MVNWGLGKCLLLVFVHINYTHFGLWHINSGVLKIMNIGFLITSQGTQISNWHIFVFNEDKDSVQTNINILKLQSAIINFTWFSRKPYFSWFCPKCQIFICKVFFLTKISRLKNKPFKGQSWIRDFASLTEWQGTKEERA